MIAVYVIMVVFFYRHLTQFKENDDNIDANMQLSDNASINGKNTSPVKTPGYSDKKTVDN